jgi:magnesium-transporting ATPase (P-type)
MEIGKAKNVAWAILAIFAVLFLLLLMEEYFFSKTNFKLEQVDIAIYQLETSKTIELFNQWSINENRRIFEWHARSTKIIFYVSILITIIGMAFAFWQFVEASNSEKIAIEAEQLEIKTQLVSLAFKSRSLATFMMFISLAYMLIYVTVVYPVKPVHSGEEFKVGAAVMKAEEDIQGISRDKKTEQAKQELQTGHESFQDKEEL